MTVLDTTEAPPNDGEKLPVVETSTESVTGNPVTLETLTDYGSHGYQTNEDGSPILGANGQPKKKPGRKPGQKSAVFTPAPGEVTGATVTTGSGPKSPAERKAQRVASEELARAVLSTAVGTMVTLVGPEWDFQSQAEADGMKAATAAYIEAKGDGQISPEAMLLLVTLGYALPRAAHENTRTKFGAFFSGAWNAFKSLFKR